MLDGHFVEENSENTLLHLTSVLSTEDNHLLLGKVESDGSTRSHTLREFVGRERTSIVDGVVGREVLELLTGRADEHVAHEECMVGAGTHDSHADSVPLIPASVSVDDVDTASRVEVVNCAFAVDLPDLFGKSRVSEPYAQLSDPTAKADGGGNGYAMQKCGAKMRV